MLMWASVALMGLAVFILTNMIFMDEDQFKAQEKLEESDQKAPNEFAKHGIVLRYSRPFFKRYFTPIVQTMKNKKKFKENIVDHWQVVVLQTL